MPWIDLEGTANARDVGGLPAEDGGKTVTGRLLRSDNLQELTPADIAKLTGELGLTTVVDLRSTAELHSEGPAPLDDVPSVEHRHHPVLPEDGLATDAVADVLLTRNQRDRSRYPDNALTGHYLGYLEDRPDQVVDALRSVAHAEGAALVHCAAGKDRTGVVVALALSVAGVRPDAIAADYAATGDRTGPLLARLRRSVTYSADVNRKPDDAHKPQADTMTAFLAELDTRYGGAAAWLTAHGLSEDDLARLRARLRTP
ncbi:MAG TPA: tyrosine-protein phosphatase [Streptosporangiaceae bacterium]|nr:tyrosine-protein phosphatase [Streptosporangiaceae bacterium]